MSYTVDLLDGFARLIAAAGLGVYRPDGVYGAGEVVRTHIATLRGAPTGAPPRPLTVRQVTGWLTRHPATLTEEDRAGLKDVLARCLELDTAAGHVRDFGEILSDCLGAKPRPGSTRSTPASCTASPASRSTCSETSRWRASAPLPPAWPHRGTLRPKSEAIVSAPG
ncbi:hypothetical protein [Streptomyces sp. NPDC004267]|uniref:hypothetical protein n=1 Tax=Streptomyces sp. NPDC004267 TaxID=3364694 RepID=UPI0036A0BFD2